MRTESISSAWNWIVGIALLNFLVFMAVALYLGGDAVNGKIANGHFFLGSHGRYTEVSETLFTYSKWHTYSVVLTHSLAFIGACLVGRRPRVGPNA
jgi:hypothetical protein